MIIAFFMVFLGMIGNIVEVFFLSLLKTFFFLLYFTPFLDFNSLLQYPVNFMYFCLYFAFAFFIVMAMLSRVAILKVKKRDLILGIDKFNSQFSLSGFHLLPSIYPLNALLRTLAQEKG